MIYYGDNIWIWYLFGHISNSGVSPQRKLLFPLPELLNWPDKMRLLPVHLSKAHLATLDWLSSGICILHLCSVLFLMATCILLLVAWQRLQKSQDLLWCVSGFPKFSNSNRCDASTPNVHALLYFGDIMFPIHGVIHVIWRNMSPKNKDFSIDLLAISVSLSQLHTASVFCPVHPEIKTTDFSWHSRICQKHSQPIEKKITCHGQKNNWLAYLLPGCGFASLYIICYEEAASVLGCQSLESLSRKKSQSNVCK